MKRPSSLTTNGHLAILLIAAILIIDQVIKIAVKTHMCLGDSIRITDWFYIQFIENNGMAYGLTFINKLFLSVFRIVAVGFIGWYLHWEINHKGRTCYIFLLSMVVAGAAGNIIDSMFYGLVFTPSSPYYVSELVPLGQGYAGFLMGRVVDMFYFPLIVTSWPSWVPVWGGQEFIFFSPIFNFADASISVGVILLLVFCRHDLERISTAFARTSKEKDNARHDTQEEGDE